MALLHSIKGDFDINIDFQKRERLLKRAMNLNYIKKGLGISLDTACRDQLITPTHEEESSPDP